MTIGRPHFFLQSSCLPHSHFSLLRRFERCSLDEPLRYASKLGSGVSLDLAHLCPIWTDQLMHRLILSMINDSTVQSNDCREARGVLDTNRTRDKKSVTTVFSMGSTQLRLRVSKLISQILNEAQLTSFQMAEKNGSCRRLKVMVDFPGDA